MALRTAEAVPLHGVAKRALPQFPLLLLGTSASFAGLWMAAPLVAVLLAERGSSAAMIGAITALGWVTALLVTPSTPRLAQAVGGALALHRIAVALSALTLALHALTDDLAVWAVLVAIRGAGSALAWTTADLLATTLAPRGREGRALGLYQTFISAAIGAGPLLASMLGAGDTLTFLGATSLLLLGLLGCHFLRPPGDGPCPRACDGSGTGILRLFLLLGPALGAAALSGLFEAVDGAMLPAHAAQAMGFAAGPAALVAAAAGLGNLLAQYPLGWLADRVAPARLTLGAAGLVGAGALLWPLLAPGPAGWAALAVLGGASGVFYSIGMIAIAKRLRGTVRMAALSWLNAAYVLGGAIGPAAAGLVSAVLPSAEALPWSLGLLGAGSGVLVAWRLGRPRSRRTGGRPAPVGAMQASLASV